MERVSNLAGVLLSSMDANSDRAVDLNYKKDKHSPQIPQS